MHNVIFALGFGCLCFHLGCHYGIKLKKDITEVIYFVGIMLIMVYFALF